MGRDTRKRLGGALILWSAIPLVIVSAAWACANLATLQLNRSSAKPGTKVQGFGQNYNPSPTASDVTVRLDSRDGRILWQGRPDPVQRTISPSFKVPNVKAGYHVLLATQSIQPSGNPAAGTPGRASLRVLPKSRARHARRSSHQVVAALWGTPRSPAPPAAAPATGGGHAFALAAPPLASILIALALAAGGFIVLLGGRRGPGALSTPRRLG